MSDYSIVEFRALTKALGAERVAVTLIRVAPQTVRSHRNLGDEPVELWAISRKIPDSDSEKVEEFRQASPEARQSVG